MELKPEIANTSCGPIEYLSRGTGPAILSAHGAMGGYDQSDILTRTIGDEGYRYISVSRPGYLGTPLSSGKTSEKQADLLAALLDSLEIEKAGFMAISGGGPSALHFALRHPDRCWGLILVSTVGGLLTVPLPFAFKIMKITARIPALVSMMQKKTEKNFQKTATRSIPDPDLLKKTMDDPVAWPLFKELTIGMFDQMAKRLPGTDNDIAITRSTTYPLEEIKVPTLVIHGTKDSVVPYEKHGAVLAKKIPGAQLCKIDGGEHVSIFTHRDIVVEQVSEFLKSYAPKV